MAEKNQVKLSPFEKESIETAKQILEYKVGAEANVVAIIYKSPDMLFNSNLSLDDFHNNIWKVYWQIAYGIVIVEKKNTLDEVTVGLYLEKHPKLKSKYTEYGEYNTIISAMGYVNINNFDGYVAELRKWGVLIQLCKKGFPIKDRLSEFADMPAEEIYNEYEAFLNHVFGNIDSDVKSYDICDGIHDLIEKLDEGFAIGLPYYDMPILTKETGGQYMGSITLLGGLSNVGKEQPVSEPVLTENGWIHMRDIKVGTRVYGRDGKLHNVTNIFPQGIKNIYEVTFNDGTSTRCGLEHLWKVYTERQRYKNNKDNKDRHKVISLKEMINDYKKEHYNKKNKCYITSYKYSVPINKPIEFNNHKELPIDAYALGLLLGDGGFTTNVITFTNPEDELFDQLERLLKPLEIELHYKNHTKCKQATLIYSHIGNRNILRDALKQLKLLGCDSRSKFIPDVYKWSSVENRAKILSGIINTDGSVESTTRRSIAISTYSKQLAKDITEVARGLGFIATFNEYDRTNKNSTKKYDKEVEYCIRLLSNDWSILSLSKKHNDRLIPLTTNRKKSIVDIKFIGKEESQCIMLDGEEHLYITKDYIVTHNSTVARSTTIPSIISMNEKILIMVNEDSLAKWQREMLVWICNNILKFDIQKHIVRDGKYHPDVKAKLHEAADWLEEKTKNHMITVIPFLQYQTAKAIKEIRKYAAMGVKYFILDTFKMDAGKITSNSWLEMQQSMVAIKDVVKTEAMNVHILITFQLEKGSSVMRYYTQNNIGLAKNIVDVASTCIMVRDIFDDEYPEEKRPLKVYRLEGKNGRTKVNVPLNKDKKYQLFFIVKNQEGAANAFQVVAEHDKSRNIINEIGITNVLPDF